jgi:carbonic anhydrase
MHGRGDKMAHTVISPAEALKLLIDGNQRWVDGQLEHPHQSVARRNEVAKHQDPFAVVFSCIDSRVPPEIVFDRGVGDLFVIRTGAQAVDDLVVLGSVEFGPNGYPSARLLLVLGHQGCGAITAAIESIQSGIPAPIHIRAVVDALRPAYDQAISQPGDDLVDKMVRAQVILTVQQLQNDSLLAPLVRSGELRVVGARYDLTTGRAEIIVDH